MEAADAADAADAAEVGEDRESEGAVFALEGKAAMEGGFVRSFRAPTTKLRN